MAQLAGIIQAKMAQLAKIIQAKMAQLAGIIQVTMPQLAGNKADMEDEAERWIPAETETGIHAITGIGNREWFTKSHRMEYGYRHWMHRLFEVGFTKKNCKKLWN